MLYRYSVVATLAAVTLWVSPADYWLSHWYGKWALLLAAGAVVYGLELSKRTHYVLGAAVTYALLSALYVFAWPGSVSEWAVIDQLAIKHSAASSAVSVLVLASVFMFSNAKFRESVRSFLVLLFFGSVLYTFVLATHVAPFHRGAFAGNASMNGCLIAILMPLALERFPSRAVIAVAAVAILLTHTSIPVGVFALAVTARFLCHRRFVSYAAAVGVLMLVAAVLIQGPAEVFSSSGRFGVWTAVMCEWYARHSVLLGSGTGTAAVLVPHYQVVAHAAEGGNFLWLHSDVLQALFEQGAAGLVIFLSLFAVCLKRSFDRPWLFSGIIAFAAAALFNYPLRLPLHALTGAYLVFEALQPKEKT